MMKTVHPHNLHARCVACGITLKDLSVLTGIHESDLLRFARGQLALSARDRLAILMTLASLDQSTATSISLNLDDDTVDSFDQKLHRLRMEIASFGIEALRMLRQECEEEEEAERRSH